MEFGVSDQIVDLTKLQEIQVDGIHDTYMAKMKTAKLREIKADEMYGKQNWQKSRCNGQVDGWHHNVGMHLACVHHKSQIGEGRSQGSTPSAPTYLSTLQPTFLPRHFWSMHINKQLAVKYADTQSGKCRAKKTSKFI